MTESRQPQKGRIFISYRRADTSYAAGRIYDRLVAKFGEDAVFMDVDVIEGGVDFVKVLEDAVQSCDVLIALIGRQWLNITDKDGNRRLDNPEDFVRIEVATALERNIRVIPVLVDGVEMPRSTDLPENLKALARRNALQVNHHSFNPDVYRLIEHTKSALDEAEVSRVMKKSQALQAARESAEKVAQQKAREEAEEQARQKAVKEETEREKKERESVEKPKPETEKPKPIEEKSINKTSQLEPKLTGTQIKQRKPGMQVAFWGIGFVAIIFIIGVIVLNNWNNTLTNISTATNSITPSLELSNESIGTLRTTVPNGAPVVSSTSTRSLSEVATEIPISNLDFDLIYLAEQDGEYSLFYIDSDGKRRDLSKGINFSYVANPVLSPDRQNVAFDTEKGIYNLKLATGVLYKLSTFGIKPVWNPNGLQLAFETGDATTSSSYKCNWVQTGENAFSCTALPTDKSNQQIYSINYLAQNSQVSKDPFIATRGVLSLRWNSDGSKFAFIKKQNVDFICVANSETWWDHDQCIQIKDYVDEFDWFSPTNKIAFSASWRGNSDIYLASFNDFTQTNLTQGVYDNYSPIFDHAGKRIAFVSTRDGNSEIYIMNIDGTIVSNVTQNAANDFSPTWLPDDNGIVFVSDRTGSLDVFFVNLENLKPINLTNNSSNNYFPILIPAP